jgi:hypothetical protein
MFQNLDSSFRVFNPAFQVFPRVILTAAKRVNDITLTPSLLRSSEESLGVHGRITKMGLWGID